jgi:uncharacterized protein
MFARYGERRGRRRRTLRGDLLVAVMFLTVSGCSSEGVAPAPRPVSEGESEQISATAPQVLTPSGDAVVVELAISDAARARGLMFRSALPENRGMLFMFPESGIHGFWMKNTFIALDIVWIDEDLRVVHLERNVPPCTSEPCPTYAPAVPATYVLEVEGGEAERLGLEPGARVELVNVPGAERGSNSSEHPESPAG